MEQIWRMAISSLVSPFPTIRGAYAAPLHSCKYRWLHAPATKQLQRVTRFSRNPFLF
jgi:hypothetical protein